MLVYIYIYACFIKMIDKWIYHKFSIYFYLSMYKL